MDTLRCFLIWNWISLLSCLVYSETTTDEKDAGYDKILLHAKGSTCSEHGEIPLCYIVYSKDYQQLEKNCTLTKPESSADEKDGLYEFRIIDIAKEWKGYVFDHMDILLVCDGHRDLLSMRYEPLANHRWSLSHVNDSHIQIYSKEQGTMMNAEEKSSVMSGHRVRRSAHLHEELITVTDMSGSISSPHYPYGYPDIQNITWIIVPLSGYRIVAQVEFLNTSRCPPPHDTICCDYLTVNDVDNSRSSEMKLCGLQTALEPLHPTGELRINFVSDDIHVIGANGFRLSYYQMKVKFTELEGVIRSPNYKSSEVSLYPDNLHIQWYVEVPEEFHVRFWFSEHFHLEGEPGSCVDKLMRGSGLEVGLAAYLPELCGKESPDMYYALSNQAWFEMTTDSNAQYEGFELYYKAEQSIFTEHEGIITSPMYPERYPTPIYTQYIIQAPAGYIVHMHIDMFDIPECVRDDNGLCGVCSDYNFLEIQTLQGPLSSYVYAQSGVYLSKRFCNGLAPREKVMSVDNGVQITFRSTGDNPGYGFRISYHFVPNQITLRSKFFTEVLFAPMGYETLGLVFYEIIVPAGHNLEAWNPHIKLRCDKQEAMVFANELEDMLYGNAQVICTEDGENIEAGPSEAEDFLFIWLQPQHKLGMSDWVMRIIISTQSTDSALQMMFWADDPVVTTSAGFLATTGYGNVWASYEDRDRGHPTNVLTAKAPTCQTIEYRWLAAPLCTSELKTVLRSPYNIPYGRDQSFCSDDLTFTNVLLDGNEFSVVASADPTNNRFDTVWVVSYKANERDVDCSFEFDMCNWRHIDDSQATVRWTRTSEEIVGRYLDKFRIKQLAAKYEEFWTSLQTQFTDYYMHVRMDESYPGEKAQMRSPLIPADVSRTLTFRYHMHGVNVGALNVYTWSPGTDRWHLVWSKLGNTDDIEWLHADGIPISACDDYHVVFEATIPRGFRSGGPGDIAVDSIFFCDVPDALKTCDDDLLCKYGRCIDVVPATINNGAAYECCCEYGYTGVDCEEQLDFCADETVKCNNGGTCFTWQPDSNGELVPAICSCAAGFTGEHCETLIDNCASDPCIHHGRCVTGVDRYHCICPIEYSGTNCEVNENMCETVEPCQNGAECITMANRGYRCICEPGYTGYNCQQELNECSTRPCQNNALCIDKYNDFQCVCKTGYGGKRCELNINSCAEALTEGLCSNGASCLDTVNGFKCQCVEGWQGQHCDVQINDCLADPCVNNARCVDRFRDFQCLCRVGYEGKRCEIMIDHCIDHRCEHGICIQDRTGYSCDCLPGFTGEFCEITINACQEFPCSAGSTCHPLPAADFYCECPVGRTGDTCSQTTDYCKDTKACLNGGSCVGLDSGFRCDCPPGFRGNLCEYEASGCQGRQCIHGICVDKGTDGFTCKCEEGWSGDHCDVVTYDTACQTRQPCDDGSTCVNIFNDYVCLCAAGRTGSQCDVDIRECESNPCMNGAQCLEGANSYSCSCLPGYRGVLCEEVIDPCENLHCYSGECVSRNGLATCECYEGYEGDECQTVTDNCARSPCHPSAACHNLIGDYSCECNPSLPLGGALCDEPIDTCASYPCRNGGQCITEGFTYRCECLDNTHGADCSTIIKPCDRNPCKHGTCFDFDRQQYECRCENGWSGSNCDILADRCSGYMCENGGSCYVNSEGHPFCVCAPTYIGPRCNQPVDVCWERVCYNGGHCKVGTGGPLSGIAYCDCAQGFDGYSCEVDLSNGALVGGVRFRRSILNDTSAMHDIHKRAADTMSEVEGTDPSTAPTCHFLGSDTTSSMRWIIVCITVGMYLIVILSAVSYTVISIRLMTRNGKESRYRKLSGSNNNSLRYYTPQKTAPEAVRRHNNTPRRVPVQPSYFSPNRRSPKSINGNAQQPRASLP